MRMRWTWRIGKIAGIEILVHPSWIIIYLLFAWSAMTFAKTVPQELFDEKPLSAVNDVVLGLIAPLVLFASVVVHEFAHALVARRLGIPIGNITLFLFGGVASILREPGTPMDEFKMAIAGPLASVVIASIFGALAWGSYVVHWPWGLTFCTLLAVLNALLAGFNLLPAFPSDGGRVLRSLIWQIVGSQARATSIASTVSAGVAMLLALGGIAWVFYTREWQGAWLVLIALFLWQAALASGRQARLGLTLEQMRVQDCMARNLVPVPDDATLASFAAGLAPDASATGYPVVADGTLVGLVTLQDTAGVPPELWEHTPVSAVMTPAGRLTSVSPALAASDALAKLATTGSHHLAVMDGGVLTGVVSQDSILAALRRGAKA